MTIVWILSWILSFIIIIKDYKTESTRWLTAITFLSGLGAFTVVFEESLNVIESNQVFSRNFLETKSRQLEKELKN